MFNHLPQCLELGQTSQSAYIFLSNVVRIALRLISRAFKSSSLYGGGQLIYLWQLSLFSHCSLQHKSKSCPIMAYRELCGTCHRSNIPHLSCRRHQSHRYLRTKISRTRRSLLFSFIFHFICPQNKNNP